MTTITTPWAHLPNAVHIDRVLASQAANHDHWNAAEIEKWRKVRDQGRIAQAVRSSAWDAARGMVRALSRDAAMNAVRSSAWNAARELARESAWDAILALCAYDDCAYMLDSDPGELAILAAFGEPRAILLLSACKVFYLISQLT